MEPFRLQNETRRRPAVKPAPRQRQLQLLSGLDCLAGQQDLIDVDGPAADDEEPDAVKAKPIISGTREWAVENVNIILGCPHKCRYCYARANALRFGKIKRAAEWGDTYHRLRADQARRPPPPGRRPGHVPNHSRHHARAPWTVHGDNRKDPRAG